MKTSYYRNRWNDKTHSAVSEELKSTKDLNPKDCPGLLYLIPCPKSPHGCDVDPTRRIYRRRREAGRQ